MYDTFSDLKTDDPEHDYKYVVLADGKWYYYDGSEWVDCGVYQSTSIQTDFDNYNFIFLWPLYINTIFL